MSDSTNTQSSYRSIFKATSLFGGVQIYQIIIQIIKSKIVAMLLGPAGIGITGLYSAGLQFIQSITSMGLTSSGVRDVSEAHGSNDYHKISQIVLVVRRLVWVTGLLGLISVVILSPMLSKMSFGNYDYTVPFIILSVTLLIDQISGGQRIVLQGLRRLKDLAMCSAWGSTIGLITSVPLYYWLGIEGIVPTLLLNSFCMLIISWLYSKNITIEKQQINTRETFAQGRQMLVMGLSMSFSSILSTGVAYIIRSYIQKIGGVEEVGLFQAGFVIMNTYVGLITNAIATDYYPRLAAINKNNAKCREAVSQQGEIATMILAPMLTVCLVFMPFMLELLYSNQFSKATDYISWACLGMMLRLASWIVAFLFVAKALSKLYIINELAGNIIYLALSLIGYHYWGLLGIGIAFAANYLVYFIQVYLIARNKFEFSFSKSFIKSFGIQLAIVIACLCTVLLTDGWIKYAIGCTFILISSALSLKGLNDRMSIVDVIRSKIKKS